MLDVLLQLWSTRAVEILILTIMVLMAIKINALEKEIVILKNDHNDA